MVCGYPHIDLAYLRQHTTYASGLTPSDAHVEAFWAVLAEFSQEELRKFVKFAANQERLPADGGTDVHQPPLPMKIAQPDPDESQANADQRWIRAETCMFMLKLPRYSSKVRLGPLAPSHRAGLSISMGFVWDWLHVVPVVLKLTVPWNMVMVFI